MRRLPSLLLALLALCACSSSPKDSSSSQQERVEALQRAPDPGEPGDPASLELLMDILVLDIRDAQLAPRGAHVAVAAPKNMTTGMLDTRALRDELVVRLRDKTGWTVQPTADELQAIVGEAQAKGENPDLKAPTLAIQGSVSELVESNDEARVQTMTLKLVVSEIETSKVLFEGEKSTTWVKQR